jgi:hypothetical protein
VWGLVKDGSGAVVANAAVVFSNVDQQRDWKTRTESDGEYVLVQVPPGNYGLSVEAPGFRRYQRRGLILEVAQTAAIDVTMELGPVTESLEVTAGTPMLESASSAIGEVINGRAAEDLPLVARNTARLIALTPGIADTFNFRLPGANSGDSNRVSVSVSGGRTLTSEVLLDGSPQATVGYLDPAYIPLPEATMELNVQTNSLPAEYGRSGGGVINIVHRSGSRDFHGVLYEFLGNDKLNANGFFDNRNGRARAPLRLNNFGFAFGGPLTPSRKTTFFYVSAQKVLVAAPMSQTFTLPTVKMKNGDFTETGPVYDPQSIDATGRRQVFAGNLIPAARWNTIGANLLKYYPDPTAPGLANNYYAQSSEYPTNTDLSVRIDRRLSDRQNLFGRFSLEDNSDRVPDFFRNVASPNARTVVPHNRSATADYSIYLHGWVLHGNYGYASTDVINHPTGEGFDITSIGFPSSMQSNAQLAVFPTIVVSGLPTLGPANGDNQASDLKYYHHALTADATRTSGSHTIKLGGSYRNYRAFVFRPNSPSGMFQFSEGFTRETFNGTTGGNAVASLLLGLPFGLSTAGGIGYEPSLTTEAPYVGAYVQDNWRVNSRLVLDMGIRWDSDRPLRELQDQTSWFDFNAALPLTLPGLGTVHGGLVFAGRNGTPRGNQDPDNNNLGPRFGLAFKAAPNLVLRSGFGLMYGITTPYGPNTFNTGALSFNAFTDFVSTIDGGRTPFTTLSNPFPSGYNTPANGRDGLLTLIGQAIGAQVRGDRTPYVTQWHINVQTELFTDALLDVGYAGSAGAKLLAITQLDQLPDQYLSLGDALTLSVANPFFGLVPPTSAIGQPTTTAGQLLRPYPQFTGVTYYWGTFSHSSYHALQAKLRKRYRGGIQMLVAYTWSKSLDDNSGSATGGNQNPGFTDNYRRDLDKSYSAYDIPHRFVTSVDSELPFGAGRQWLNHKGIGNAFYGGWRMGSIVSLQSGPPISVASSINTTGSFGGGQRPDRTGVSSRTPGGVEDRLDNYIAQNAFVNPRRYTFGNAGRFLPENRAPGLANVNLSLTKSVRPIERLRLDFRGELYNLFNHPNFRIPAGSATGVFGLPQFGTITTAESQRQITLAVKLYF